MKVRGILPSRELRPYVDRYWAWENERELPDVLPGTGNELIFHYGKPWLTLSPAHKERLPVCCLLSPRQTNLQVEPDGLVGFISVRFRAGALRHFCPLPVQTLVDHAVAVEDIWGEAGRNLREQLCEATDLAQRIQIFEEALRRFFHCFHKPEAWLDEAVRRLYYRNPALGTTHLGDELFVSDRQLQRKIKECVGVTPKTFQRIVRFEGVLKRLMLQEKNDYLALALDNGYYDQAHFIKEFKGFVGETPSVYLKESKFHSHYYCEKL